MMETPQQSTTPALASEADELLLRARVRALEINIERVLDQVAELVRPCVRCGVQIWFVRTKAGKLMPYCFDGTSHFANCPHAAEFRRTSSI